MTKDKTGLFKLKPSTLNRFQRIWKLAKVEFGRRYYNSFLGPFWALLNPLFRILIFYFVFKNVFNVNEEDYAFILFSGIIIWSTFGESTRKGITTLKSKRYLLESIQFNKIDLYLANIIGIFLGFLFTLSSYLVIATFAGITIGWNIVFFPLLIVILFLLSLGASMILSVLHIYLKDIEHLWSMVLVFGFWTSGVFHRTDIFVNAFPAIKYLHPYIGIIKNARQMILFNGPLDWPLMLYGFMYSIVIFLIGYYLMKKYSHKAIENF